MGLPGMSGMMIREAAVGIAYPFFGLILEKYG